MNKILAILFCCISLTMAAQTAVVKGLVKDEVSQKVLDSATVSLNGTSYAVVTGPSGMFVITGVPYGRYTIEVKENTHATYSQLIDVNQPEVIVGSIGLRGADAPAEIVAEKATETEEVQAKTLVDDAAPVATLTEDDTKDLGDGITGSLGASRDVFVTSAAIVMGEAHFRIRGYKPEEAEVFMNGVPVNDLYRGGAMFNTWGGLNNILHNRDITIGLGESNYSFGGVGGSYSLDTRASKQWQGLNISYSNANRNFSHRLMATYNTGVLKSGWAVSASFTKRWAKEGYVPGTTYDGYSYHFSVDKHFGAKHILSLTAYGSSLKQGIAEPETKEAYFLAGSNYYNWAWGYQGGAKRNAFVRESFEPQFILNHEWNINSKSKLTTAAGFSFGKEKLPGLEYSNAPNPNPTYYKNMPSYITDSAGNAIAQQTWRGRDQLDWNHLYDVNRNSTQLVTNANGIPGNNEVVNLSRYLLYDRVNDIKRFNFNTNYNTKFNEHISFTAGLKYQFEQSENYNQIKDLLGGTYFLDVDQYAPLTYPGNINVAQKNLNTPQRLVTVGDKFDNDYITVEHKSTVWAQPDFHFGNLDFFVAAQLSFTAYWRNGLYKNGLFPNSSFGKSTVNDFVNYAFKGGLTYKIAAGHYVYANGGYFTRAPYLVDAYVSPATRDEVAPGLTNEQIYSGEAGYMYKTPRIKLRASFFISQFNNQTQTTSYFDYELSSFVNNTLTGMNSRHMGGELSFEANVYKGFSVSAVGTLGQYIYTNRPRTFVTADNSATVLVNNELVYLKNYHVAGTPELATSLGLRYRSPKAFYIDLYFNYYGRNYVSINPERRTVEAVAPLNPSSGVYQQIIQQEKLPDAFTMDLFAGYSWLINKQFPKIKKYKYFVVLGVNVSNLTNNRNFITRGFEQLEFDAKGKNLAYFPNKYVYAYGANYHQST